MTNLGRSSARAIGSEKHVLKRASPFTYKTTDCSIPSDKEAALREQPRIELLSKLPDKKKGKKKKRFFSLINSGSRVFFFLSFSFFYPFFFYLLGAVSLLFFSDFFFRS
ncbi:hypothetical protein PUN28_018896 [Cardiocondyla obscurior]|uniref:Uncharacterized protein n=1 Tax=Cardiocondyla obscurior TaxID=286306 RepID=A0AAW2EEH9_9HYME